MMLVTVIFASQKISACSLSVCNSFSLCCTMMTDQQLFSTVIPCEVTHVETVLTCFIKHLLNSSCFQLHYVKLTHHISLYCNALFLEFRSCCYNEHHWKTGCCLIHYTIFAHCILLFHYEKCVKMLFYYPCSHIL